SRPRRGAWPSTTVDSFAPDRGNPPLPSHISEAFAATVVSGRRGPDSGEVSAEAVYHTFVLTLRPSGRSAYAGDHMPETHPPLVPEPPAPDTARPPLAEEKPESEKVDRRTAVWHAVQRPFQAFDRLRIRETAISAMIVVILAIGVVSNLPD